VLMLDEISTGLNSAVLFSIISLFFKQSIAALGTTTLVLVAAAAAAEVMTLFDDVILVHEG